MKCFHFTSGETKGKEQGGAVPRPQAVSSSSFSTKLYWARSLSGASSSSTASTLNGRSLRRSSEFEFDDLSSSSCSGFHEYLLLNHRQRREGNDDEDDDDDQLRVFTFAELKAGTRGFSRAHLIGEGGFGCVYRGVVRVPSGEKIEVAVKQLNRHGLQGHKEWINEVNLLGVIKHPNLVKLVGYCAEDDERGMQRLLVYELMKNKSLEDHLLSSSRVTLPTSTTTTTPLPWMTRLRIAQDAARGLAYLHEEMEFQLIFRDFKTSNILLDEEFNAKLSDFGLARLGPPEGLGHVSTCVVGTVGYAAPEYVQTGRLTVKSDVWSFGVVLYELITGRRALERNLPRAEQKLLEWVRPYVSDSKKFHLIVDPRLKSHYCMKSAQRVASLANKCLTKHPKSRPKMSEVVEMMGNIINEISPTEGGASHPVSATGEVQEETKGEPEPMVEAPKQSSSHRKKGFDIREMVNLRNRSIGKLDWRNWTPGLVRTGS